MLPAPNGPLDHDPLPPVRVLTRDHSHPGQYLEALGPRHYLGRVRELEGDTFVLRLWEVPNARELVANVSRDTPGVAAIGQLKRGTAINLWTWQEVDHDGHVRERIHLEPIDRFHVGRHLPPAVRAGR